MIMEWIEGFATPSAMGYFLTGFVLAYVLTWMWCLHKKRKLHITWRYAGIAIGATAIVFASVQTQAAYNLSARTALEVQRCQHEFQQALKARSKIAEDNDKWSAIQRKALGDWLFEIIVPPPHIQDIRASDPNFSNNPEYIKWGIDITTKYSNIVQNAQREQDANEEERRRPENQLPEPTCGN